MKNEKGSKSFEEALADLEKCVQRLEDGQIGLEEALRSYEEGVGLLRHCHGLLQSAEQRILQLSGVDEEGKPVTGLFDAEEGAEASGETQRKRRRGG
jgi:exodeoxyribonuclease VII small subunit